MREESLKVSIVGAEIFIRKYMYKKNSITRTPGSGCLSDYRYEDNECGVNRAGQ